MTGAAGDKEDADEKGRNAGDSDSLLAALEQLAVRTTTRRPSRIPSSVEDCAAQAAVLATVARRHAAADGGRSPTGDSETDSDAFCSSSEATPIAHEAVKITPPEGAAAAASASAPAQGLRPPTSPDVRRNSQAVFAEKMHTTLVLDWDDTIFPTTWVREELDWRFPVDQQPGLGPGRRLDAIQGFLDRHFVQTEEFLTSAASHANVFVVTLARRPWVETSMHRFMPELADVMRKYDFKVIYAQELADQTEIMNHFQNAPGTVDDDVAFWTRIKAAAIAKELDDFHSRVGASWKNIISLGDSDFERYGTISAGQDYMHREMQDGGALLNSDGQTHEGVSKDGHLKRLRLKTIKMLDKPSILELTAELVLLKRWLPHVVCRDSGFDLEIEGTDDDAVLVELHRKVTGEDESTLTWRQLAGLLD